MSNMTGLFNINYAISKLFLRQLNLLEVQEGQVDQADPAEGENSEIKLQPLYCRQMVFVDSLDRYADIIHTVNPSGPLGPIGPENPTGPGGPSTEKF